MERNKGPESSGPFVFRNEKRPGIKPGLILVNNLARLPVLVLPPKSIGLGVLDFQHGFFGCGFGDELELDHFVDGFRIILFLLALVQFLESRARRDVHGRYFIPGVLAEIYKPRGIINRNGLVPMSSLLFRIISIEGEDLLFALLDDHANPTALIFRIIEGRRRELPFDPGSKVRWREFPSARSFTGDPR